MHDLFYFLTKMSDPFLLPPQILDSVSLLQRMADRVLLSLRQVADRNSMPLRWIADRVLLHRPDRKGPAPPRRTCRKRL